MQKELDILVTLDENYMAQLRVLLTSIYLNHPGLSCRIFLLHRHLPGHVLRNLPFLSCQPTKQNFCFRIRIF